jgi:hypothetical protein
MNNSDAFSVLPLPVQRGEAAVTLYLKVTPQFREPQSRSVSAATELLPVPDRDRRK